MVGKLGYGWSQIYRLTVDMPKSLDLVFIETAGWGLVTPDIGGVTNDEFVSLIKWRKYPEWSGPWIYLLTNHLLWVNEYHEGWYGSQHPSLGGLYEMTEVPNCQG